MPCGRDRNTGHPEGERVTTLERVHTREDVREEILRASHELMREGGIAALSMREVARRTGVSHQAPYHYFPDREAILAELIGGGFNQLYDYMVSSLGTARTRSDKMRRIGEAYVRFAFDDPELFKLMFRCDMCDLSRHPEQHANATRVFDLVAQSIGVSGTAANKADPDLTPVIANWSLVHGLSTLILEGKLATAFGDTRAQKEAAAGRVIDFMASLYGD
jgi:AcrR family transcriptional regulator